MRVMCTDGAEACGRDCGLANIIDTKILVDNKNLSVEEGHTLVTRVKETLMKNRKDVRDFLSMLSRASRL